MHLQQQKPLQINHFVVEKTAGKKKKKQSNNRNNDNIKATYLYVIYL